MASEVVEKTMYKKTYAMVHNPVARGRQPRYLVNGTMKPKGVTTILGNTLSKDLMDWAVSACCNYLRTKLPVVTEEDLVIGADEYKRLRDAGGSTGSEAHYLVENFLKGRKPEENATNSVEAVNAYNAFVSWFVEATPEVLAVESVVFSPRYMFAGTFDALMKIDGKIYLCDLKTTNPSRKAPNGVYAEYFLQMGAYALAYEEERKFEIENGGTELPEIDDFMVISAKKNGKIDIVTASSLGLDVESCGELFRDVLGIHDFLLNTTKQLGGK